MYYLCVPWSVAPARRKRRTSSIGRWVGHSLTGSRRERGLRDIAIRPIPCISSLEREGERERERERGEWERERIKRDLNVRGWKTNKSFNDFCLFPFNIMNNYTYYSVQYSNPGIISVYTIYSYTIPSLL